MCALTKLSPFPLQPQLASELTHDLRYMSCSQDCPRQYIHSLGHSPEKDWDPGMQRAIAFAINGGEQSNAWYGGAHS
jgi:hypothetical protein